MIWKVNWIRCLKVILFDFRARLFASSIWTQLFYCRRFIQSTHIGGNTTDYNRAVGFSVQSNTGLSKHQQLTACKELEFYGIIKVKYHGMPKKRYFKFDATKFKELYNDFLLNSNQSKENDNSSSDDKFEYSF